MNNKRANFDLRTRGKTYIYIMIFLLAGIGATGLFYYLAMDMEIIYPIKPDNTITAPVQKKEVVYFGVISRYPPNIILRGYQPIMDYLSAETKYKFELKLKTTYEETARQLINGEVAAAFFGSYLYIKAHRQYGIIPILKPLNENFEPVFRSVLITREDSKIKTINDIKGRPIALPSKESFSGNWLSSTEISSYGIKKADIGPVLHFAHHHSVVYQVLKGNFDVGVVKEIVAREYADRGLKILAASGSIPGSPIVTTRNSNAEIINEIKRALLKINVNDAACRALMKNWDKEFIHGFVEAADNDYDSIRVLLKDGEQL